MGSVRVIGRRLNGQHGLVETHWGGRRAAAEQVDHAPPTPATAAGIVLLRRLRGLRSVRHDLRVAPAENPRTYLSDAARQALSDQPPNIRLRGLSVIEEALLYAQRDEPTDV
jgi:hypothetical protein